MLNTIKLLILECNEFIIMILKEIYVSQHVIGISKKSSVGTNTEVPIQDTTQKRYHSIEMNLKTQ